MEFKDYYKILEVERGATQDEIKRSYRRLARAYHPDLSKKKGDEARFKDVGEAYEALKDPEKRAAYDRLGAEWKAGQEFKPPPDWNAGFEFSGGGGADPRGAGQRDADLSDFFASLFGRSRRAEPRERESFPADGEDRHAKVLIDLEDAFRGAARTITLQAPEVDPAGRVALREHRLNVTIPKGVAAGQHLRLAGQGAPGVGGGRPGDLYLEIEFRPHPRFRVDGRDVLLDVPVAPWEAELGASVQVPTPDGVVDLKIPAGSFGGRKLRLKGRGLPGATPGDLYVVLQIALPPAADASGIAAYRQLAERFKDFHPRGGTGGST